MGTRGYEFFAPAPAPAGPPVDPALPPAPALAGQLPVAAPPHVPAQTSRGWAPPSAAVTPPLPAARESETGLPVWAGLAVTGVALLASVVLQVFSPRVIGSATVVDQQLRIGLVVTLAFYVVLGLVLLFFVNHFRVRLVWHRAGVPAAVAIGLSAGAAGGLIVLALNSAISHHLQSDPRIEALVGGGGFLRIALTLVVTAGLAPVVEETVFRGICAGSLRGKGATIAVMVSAAAFAVWHLNLVALRYYIAVGALLALLWLKRGLLASMSAHAAFNGVLTVAAVLATSGASSAVTLGDVSWDLPGGWHARSQLVAGLLPVVEGDTRLLAGPAGAMLVAERGPMTPQTQSVPQIEQLLRSEPSTSALRVMGRPRLAATSIGPAVLLDFLADGQPGHLLVADYAGQTYQLTMVTGGSPEAEAAWREAVGTLRAD